MKNNNKVLILKFFLRTKVFSKQAFVYNEKSKYISNFFVFFAINNLNNKK